MPIPFLIPIIVVGITALFGVGLSVAYWDDILIYFKGKNLTIFGASETGKTTLHTFLRNGEIVTEHIATKRNTKVEKNRFKLQDLGLLIKEGTDVNGLKENEADWKEIFKKSDICFYLFDTSKVYNGDNSYLENMRFHLTHIDKWKNEFKIKPIFILIGTFADWIPEFNTLNKSNVQVFEQKIREKIRPAYLQASISPSDIFIGSLKDKESMEQLVSEILIRIATK